MKKIVEFILKILAKSILTKYKPEIVGITGSVGKTSTKEAIYTVLASKFKVRRNIKNYNNEIGLPLTVIGTESVGRSVFGWVIVFFKAIKIIIFKDRNYPKILVLEMGADKPGDIGYLNTIVKCKVGVITVIGSVHAEHFGTIEKLQEEKSKLIKGLGKNAYSIINYDDERTRSMINLSKAKVITYGLDSEAIVRADEIGFSFIDKDVPDSAGINYNLSYDNKKISVMLHGALGSSLVYSTLAAAAVGIAYKMNLGDISGALANFKSPKGRMNIIKGVKSTIIIDDSYNAEPKSTIAALGALKMIPLKEGKRKFAVLGDMLELGKYSEIEHKNIGKYAVKCEINKLIVVGERARDIAREAEEAGMKRDDIFNFDDSYTAGKFIEDRIKEGDLILVKGSQGIRMEKIVKEIMAEPLRAKELIVRQEEEWLRN